MVKLIEEPYDIKKAILTMITTNKLRIDMFYLTFDKNLASS